MSREFQSCAACGAVVVPTMAGTCPNCGKQLMDPAAVTEEWSLPASKPAEYPRELRDASNGFLIPAILYLALGGVFFYLSLTEGAQVGRWIAVVLVMLGGTLNLIGGILAHRGHPSVTTFAWWALPFVVVTNFPFGTVLGLYTAAKLGKPQVLHYLAQRRQAMAATDQ